VKLIDGQGVPSYEIHVIDRFFYALKQWMSTQKSAK
jgi:hypothetical protein